jgi:hypothetical protein
MKSLGQTQEEYYRGVRMVPYDLIKELAVALAGVGVLTIVLAAFLSSPDVPPVTIATWSQTDPVDFVTTATGELAARPGAPDTGSRTTRRPTRTRGGARSRLRLGSACASRSTRPMRL